MPDHTPGPSATDALVPIVYEELKRLAHQRLRAAGAGATLCTTELVHEAFLRLAHDPGAGWQSRAHFFGAAARAMRQVLTDFARRRGAAKRGRGWQRISLSDAEATLQVELEELLALDSALNQLDALNERLRRVVELRFFGGVPEHEVAEMLGVTPRTVERDWVKAKLFLLRELDPGHASGRPRGG